MFHNFIQNKKQLYLANLINNILKQRTNIHKQGEPNNHMCLGGSVGFCQIQE